ncbi:SDR family oxidoreductase [Sphingomonas sp. TX0543]|uniref:SDR family oxidoreductase n=1 Tax=Sphingomonas sp. TX0543 TaxID=3399682 RepID=UPI003AFA7ABC
MQIKGKVALVTGANRGLGRQFALQLIARGASKVYAAVRDPAKADVPGAEVIALDITDPVSVQAAAATAADVQILINNAGVATYTNFLDGDLAKIRLEIDTHYFGTLSMVRAFAPLLASNGGGAVLNVLSGLSWFSLDGANSYCAAKAAEWSLTNGLRLELIKQGTTVTGVILAAADTDMTAGWDIEKANPRDIVREALDGLVAGKMEVLADEPAKQSKSLLAADPSVIYPQAVFAH